MNTLQDFFNPFWTILMASMIILPLIQWGRHLYFNGTASVFASPNSFRELSSFTKEERMRLFHQAVGEAFPRWRFFWPVLFYGMMFSCIVAMVTMLHHSLISAVILVMLGTWLAHWREVRRIRPFLRIHVEQTHHTP